MVKLAKTYGHCMVIFSYFHYTKNSWHWPRAIAETTTFNL